MDEVRRRILEADWIEVDAESRSPVWIPLDWQPEGWRPSFRNPARGRPVPVASVEEEEVLLRELELEMEREYRWVRVWNVVGMVGWVIVGLVLIVLLVALGVAGPPF